MPAIFPVASTNRQTASTFGPMDPAGNDRVPSSPGEAQWIGWAR